MSATKNGTQRSLSRNKGQVLVWDEGWGRAGQMFTWNGLSLHPQATGAAGAWQGAPRPTTIGHCKGSDPSQMGTNPKAPRRNCQPRLWSLPPSPCPLLGRERAGRAGLVSHSGSTCFSGFLQNFQEWLGRLYTIKVTLPLKQVGLKSLQLDKELHQPRGCFFATIC